MSNLDDEVLEPRQRGIKEGDEIDVILVPRSVSGIPTEGLESGPAGPITAFNASLGPITAFNASLEGPITEYFARYSNDDATTTEE